MILLTTFTFFSGSSVMTDSNLVSLVKNLQLKVDQQSEILNDLTSELLDTKTRVKVLKEQVKTCSCSKQDPLLPQNNNELELLLGKLMREAISRERRSTDTDSLPSQQLSGFSTLIAQALTQEQLRQTLRCNATDQLGGECSIRPGPKGEKGDEGRRGVKGDQGDQGHKEREVNWDIQGTKVRKEKLVIRELLVHKVSEDQ